MKMSPRLVIDQLQLASVQLPSGSDTHRKLARERYWTFMGQFQDKYIVHSKQAWLHLEIVRRVLLTLLQTIIHIAMMSCYKVLQYFNDGFDVSVNNKIIFSQNHYIHVNLPQVVIDLWSNHKFKLTTCPWSVCHIRFQFVIKTITLQTHGICSWDGMHRKQKSNYLLIRSK